MTANHTSYRPFHSFALLLITVLISGAATMAQQVLHLPLDSSPAPKTTVIKLKPNGIKVPRGGHLQGIQCLNDSTLIITASSGSYSYYLLAQFNPATGKGRLTSIHKISDGPFRHAGGCQLYGRTLAVGIEDNISKNKSDIMLISFDEKGNETARKVVAHRSGEVKRSTAGAVGFTKLANNQYMLIVGDWDSRNLDIYVSKPGVDSIFDSIATVQITDIKNIPSYQALNLFCDINGDIHIEAFALDGTTNRCDDFMLHPKQDNLRLLHKGTENYKCKGGAGFRFASGINAPNGNRFTIYTCSRGTRPFTIVNVFHKGEEIEPRPGRLPRRYSRHHGS